MKPTHRNICQLRICLRCPTKWTGTCQTGAHDCLARAGHSALQQSLRANRGRCCRDLIYPSVQRPIMGRDWCCQMSHLRATLMNTDEPKQRRLPTRTDVWWCSWSHEVHIWIDTLCPRLRSCGVAVQRKQRKRQPSRGKEYKNVYNGSLSGFIWHVQEVKDKDLQSNLPNRPNDQKTTNQRKINAIHEATLVVKALLWLCLLSI